MSTFLKLELPLSVLKQMRVAEEDMVCLGGMKSSRSTTSLPGGGPVRSTPGSAGLGTVPSIHKTPLCISF